MGGMQTRIGPVFNDMVRTVVSKLVTLQDESEKGKDVHLSPLYIRLEAHSIGSCTLEAQSICCTCTLKAQYIGSEQWFFRHAGPIYSTNALSHNMGFIYVWVPPRIRKALQIKVALKNSSFIRSFVDC